MKFCKLNLKRLDLYKVTYYMCILNLLQIYFNDYNYEAIYFINTITYLGCFPVEITPGI